MNKKIKSKLIRLEYFQTRKKNHLLFIIKVVILILMLLLLTYLKIKYQ